MIRIQNDGQEIVKTNFWQTEHARRGGFFLSINAGVIRLLVPYRHKYVIEKFETAKSVIITHSPGPRSEACYRTEPHLPYEKPRDGGQFPLNDGINQKPQPFLQSICLLCV